MRVRVRSPTPDWLCSAEDGAPSPAPVEVDDEPAEVNKSTARSRRRRALKGGGRKEGGEKSARRRREILNYGCHIKSSFALKTPLREVTLNEGQVRREKAEVDSLLDYLGFLDPMPGNPSIPQDTRHAFVRRFLLARLAKALAEEEAAVRRASGSRARTAYYARRIVAGWGQLLDLWDAGEEGALSRAQDDGALIFRGARFNSGGVRDRLSMYIA